jgi:hypothetical protein
MADRKPHCHLLKQKYIAHLYEQHPTGLNKNFHGKKFYAAFDKAFGLPPIKKEQGNEAP